MVPFHPEVPAVRPSAPRHGRASEPRARLVDLTHEELISLVARLEAGDGDADALFSEFREHLERCFAAEEELMRLYGFAALASHREAHEALRRQLALLGRERCPAMLFGFLSCWWNEHVCHADREANAFIRSLAARATPS